MNNKLVEDSYKLASKLTYLTNLSFGVGDATNEAVAFALGSKEPSILIELMSMFPYLYKNGTLKTVVDEVLADESVAKTAKGMHLSALKQYAYESDKFNKDHGDQMLLAIAIQNKSKLRADKCGLIITDLVYLANPAFNGYMQAKIYEKEACKLTMEQYAQMLKGYRTPEMFNESRLAYLNEAREYEISNNIIERNNEKIIDLKLSAHLINKTLCFSEETPNDYIQLSPDSFYSTERNYLTAKCALKENSYNTDENPLGFLKELGNQELSEAGKACISFGREIMANAESSDAPDME